MLLTDIIAAIANEGFSWHCLRRYGRKLSCADLDLIYDKFGERLYRDIMWEYREKEAVLPPKRASLSWPIQRAGSNVVQLNWQRR